MKLDGASLLLMRQVLNTFCEYHNLSIADDTALEAADLLVRMMMHGNTGAERLKAILEDWFSTI